MSNSRLPLRRSVCVAATLIASFTAFSRASSQATSEAPLGIVRIVITTSKGVISAELDSAHAPISVTNFLRYVDAELYNAGRFHRTVTMTNQPRDSVRIEVIQASPRRTRPDSGFAPITLERTNLTGLLHTDGALSMARGGPNSASGDFFIVIGAQPSLDFGGHRNLDGQGFAVFGHVTKGMDVVRAIQQSPVEAQALTPPISILRVQRTRTPR